MDTKALLRWVVPLTCVGLAGQRPRETPAEPEYIQTLAAGLDVDAAGRFVGLDVDVDREVLAGPEAAGIVVEQYRATVYLPREPL